MAHRPRLRRRATTAVRGVGSALLVVLACAVPARAQGKKNPGATPFLESGSWQEALERRLDALGLLGRDLDPSGGAGTRGQLALALLAADSSTSAAPPVLAVVRRYRERFCAEFAASCRAARGMPRRAWAADGAVLSAGYADRGGTVLTAVGWPPEPEVPPNLTPPQARAPLRSPLGFADVSALGPGFAVRVSARATSEGAGLVEGYVGASRGVARVWAGRRQLRFGYGQGSLIIGGRVPLDGAGLEAGAFRLPWVFRHLGAVHAETGLFQLHEVAPYPHPWLWTLRASVSPHPRFQVAVERAAMVATEGSDLSTRFTQLLQVLIGKHSVVNRQDNQIASFDFRYRPPLGPLPVSLYLEWGLEDTAGSWRKVPGVIAGAYLGTVPGVPALAVGVERASFAPRCCGNPWWYRHRGFEGGWTDDRKPLGHPLGGEGWEWRAWTDAIPAPWLVGTLSAILRDRGIENLYAPSRTGRSAGAMLDLRFTRAPGPELGLRGRYENGDGWAEHDFAITLGYRF